MGGKAYIQILPSEKVVFENVDGQRSVTNVKIKNLTFHRVAFKVKSTAPDKYTVFPNKDIILPGETQSITFTMKAFVQKITSRELLNLYQDSSFQNDKFMVQAVFIEDEIQLNDLQSIWHHKPQEVIQNIKLGVSLVQAQSPSEHQAELLKKVQEQEYQIRSFHDREDVLLRQINGLKRNLHKVERIEQQNPIVQKSSHTVQILVVILSLAVGMLVSKYLQTF